MKNGKEHLGHFLWTGIKDTSLLAEEKKAIQAEEISGLILFKRNIKSLEQLFELCKEIHQLNPPPLIMMDREGGEVDRLKHLPEFFNWPPPEILAKICSLEEIEKTGFYMAQELKALGICINFAPVIDVPSVSNTLFKGRVFGKTPEEVFQKAKAYFLGLKKAGLAACAKHFPGHGGGREDSHLTLPADHRNFEILYNKDLLPFRKIIAEKIDMIMSAHLFFPQVDPFMPVTLSPIFLQKILREQMNFQSLIVSDDLDMKALQNIGLSLTDRMLSFLKAGGDIWLKCEPSNLWELLDEVKQNLTKEKKNKPDIELKLNRLQIFRKKYSTIKPVSSLEELKKITTQLKALKWQEELMRRMHSLS